MQIPYRADSVLLGLTNKAGKRVMRDSHVETIEPLESETLRLPIQLDLQDTYGPETRIACITSQRPGLDILMESGPGWDPGEISSCR